MMERLDARVRRTLLGLALVCSLCAGCKLYEKRSESIWPLDQEKLPQVPTKMAATWSDTVLYESGKPGMRGFGGRLFFYDQRMNSIKVEGRLIVYVFDDDSNGQTNSKPQRKLQFSAEDLNRHCTGSDMGPSYSIWIPWGPVGGATKELSIVPFFVSKEGGVITGSQTRHRLPGVEKPTDASAQAATESHSRSQGGYPARQVSHEEPATHTAASPSNADKRLQFRTTTIQVTPATRERLLQSTMPNERTSNPRDTLVPGEAALSPPSTGAAGGNRFDSQSNYPRWEPWERAAARRPTPHSREWGGRSAQAVDRPEAEAVHSEYPAFDR